MGEAYFSLAEPKFCMYVFLYRTHSSANKESDVIRQIVYEDKEQDWTQDRSLGHTR